MSEPHPSKRTAGRGAIAQRRPDPGPPRVGGSPATLPRSPAATRRHILLPIGASALAGSQLSLLRLVDALPASQMRFTAWVFEEGPLLAELTRRGIPHQRFARSVLRTPWGWWRLYLALRRERPDVIYLHASRVLAGLARQAGVPCLERVNMPRTAGAGGWCRYRRLDRWASNLNSGLLPVSEALARQLTERGVPREKVCVLRDLIHPAQFRRPELREPTRDELGLAGDDILVVTIGRLVPQKAPDLFARVARAVAAVDRRFRFMWVGDGPLADVLAVASGCQDAPAAAGTILRIPFRPDVAPLLAAADLYLQTSRWEGLANTLLEAMAAGLPIVASDVDGTSEALSRYPFGRLVPADDVAAMAAAVSNSVRRAEPGSAPAGILPGAERHSTPVDFPAIFTAGPVVDHFLHLIESAAAGRTSEVAPQSSATSGSSTPPRSGADSASSATSGSSTPPRSGADSASSATAEGGAPPRGGTASSGDATPVIVLANDPFDSQWRRKQQLYSRLARRRPVLYVDPPFSILDFARGRRELAAYLRQPVRVESPTEGLTVLSGSWGLPGETYRGWITTLNARLHRRWIPHALRHADCSSGMRAGHDIGRWERAILICYWPLYHPDTLETGVSRLIYDAIDDYAALTPFRRLREQLDRAADQLAAAADLTIVTNARLADRFAGVARRIEILPHGVDPGLFHPGAHRGTRFAPLRDESMPKAVFHGTLDQRLDLDVLAALLRSGITLLLAGQAGWRAGELDRLKACGDCRYFGELDQKSVAALVSAADVGIIPYRPLSGMDRVQTLKRLEFLACGLPVVATGMDPYHDYRDQIILANGPESFVRAVRRAEALSPLDRDARLALAGKQTWNARVDRLEACLESC